jgi:hypothetical protein
MMTARLGHRSQSMNPKGDILRRWCLAFDSGIPATLHRIETTYSTIGLKRL